MQRNGLSWTHIQHKITFLPIGVISFKETSKANFKSIKVYKTSSANHVDRPKKCI